MRINSENKSMDMEARDINYILPAYIRSYLFYTKNKMPERIIFPMFSSVRFDGIDVPIDYLPPLDPVTIEITQDGSNVAEVTPAQEAEIDTKDEEIKKLRAELDSIRAKQTERGEVGVLGSTEGGTPETELEAAESDAMHTSGLEDSKPDTTAKASKAKAAFATNEVAAKLVVPDRKPKLPPGGDIGPGAPLSDMHPRDNRSEKRMKADLMEEPDIDEGNEKVYEKEISRDEQGRPVVKED